jgi:Skp family chaperone for outer membrane proteins
MRQSSPANSPYFPMTFCKEFQVMKVFRVNVVASLFFVLIVSAHAQTRLVKAGTTDVPNIQPPAAGSIAVIDSGVFAEDKGGITRVSTALKQLDTKFTPIQTEIKGMQDRLTAMRNDIEKKRATSSPAVIAQQTEQADQLELQIKRKAEDARADYQKQIGITLQPLQAEVATALNTYAQAHGILIIIDVNRVPLIYANESIDITKDFIAEYNRAHPAGGAPATPRP